VSATESTLTPATGTASFFTVFPSIMLPMFLAVLDQTIVATALPAIVADLGEIERVSWIIVSYLVATTLAAPVYGRLGDFFGRRRVMLVALAVFVVASLACALARSVTLLAAARVLQGLGGGGLMTSSQALIGETMPPRDRARYQGYLATVAVSANAFGPVVGGYLTQHLGWQSVFLINVPLGIAAALLVLRLPARQGSEARFRFDAAGLVLFAACVVPALAALQRVQQAGTAGLAVTLGLFALAALAAFALVRVERRLDAPLIPVTLLARPSIWRCDTLAACHGAILVPLLTFLPIYLRVVRGSSAAETGWLLLPLTVGIGVGSLTTGRLMSRTGRTAIFPSVGLVVVVASLLVLTFAVEHLSAGALMVLFAVNAVFMGTVMGVVQVTVQAVAGREGMGAAAGSVQFSRAVGAALGTSIVSAVLFISLVRVDPEAARLFGEMVEIGPEAIANLPQARLAVLQVEVADAFRNAFLAISAFAVAATALAWSIPMRRLK
jgi:EmrB/QacA subfamily drug resistance transporter